MCVDAIIDNEISMHARTHPRTTVAMLISSVTPGRHPGFVTTRVRRPVAASTRSVGGKFRPPVAAQPKDPSVQARVAAGSFAATTDTGPEALPIKQPTSHGSPTKASERRSQMYPVAEATPARVRVRPEAAPGSPNTPQPPCPPRSPHTPGASLCTPAQPPSLTPERQSRASAVLRIPLPEAREEATEEAREEATEEVTREEAREEVGKDAIHEPLAVAPITRQRVPFPSLASELPPMWSHRPYHHRTRAAAIQFDERLEASSNGARRALVVLERTGGSSLHASRQLER